MESERVDGRRREMEEIDVGRRQREGECGGRDGRDCESSRLIKGMSQGRRGRGAWVKIGKLRTTTAIRHLVRFSKVPCSRLEKLHQPNSTRLIVLRTYLITCTSNCSTRALSPKSTLALALLHTELLALALAPAARLPARPWPKRQFHHRFIACRR